MSTEISTVMLTIPSSMSTELSKATPIIPSPMSTILRAMLTAISVTVPIISTARAMRDATDPRNVLFF